MSLQHVDATHDFVVCSPCTLNENKKLGPPVHQAGLGRVTVNQTDLCSLEALCAVLLPGVSLLQAHISIQDGFYKLILLSFIHHDWLRLL